MTKLMDSAGLLTCQHSAIRRGVILGWTRSYPVWSRRTKWGRTGEKKCAGSGDPACKAFGMIVGLVPSRGASPGFCIFYSFRHRDYQCRPLAAASNDPAASAQFLDGRVML
jgi:hypothetical protein